MYFYYSTLCPPESSIKDHTISTATGILSLLGDRLVENFQDSKALNFKNPKAVSGDHRFPHPLNAPSRSGRLVAN